MTTVSSTSSSPSSSRGSAPFGPVPARASYYRRRGTNAPNWPLVHCQGHQPSTGGYGLRVMPAAPSREPSARRAWSIRPDAEPGQLGRCPLAGRPHVVGASPVHHRAHPRRPAPRRRRARLPVAGLVQRLVRVRAEHGSLRPGPDPRVRVLDLAEDPAAAAQLRCCNDSATPDGAGGRGHDLRAGPAPLPGARPGWPRWPTVPVLYDGFEIQLEHLIMADVPFLFLLMLAITMLLWNPAGPSLRTCACSSACCSASPTASGRSACRCSRSSPST